MRNRLRGAIFSYIVLHTIFFVKKRCWHTFHDRKTGVSTRPLTAGKVESAPCLYFKNKRKRHLLIFFSYCDNMAGIKTNNNILFPSYIYNILLLWYHQ
jgi:hypothetical protein